MEYPPQGKTLSPGEYYLRVKQRHDIATDVENSCQSYSLRWDGGTSGPVVKPPQLSLQPRPLTAPVGSSVTFMVTADSTLLGYQWRKDGAPLSNSSRITGATSATLSISNVQLADAGNYDVIVSNSAGPTTSAPAILTVQTVSSAELTFAVGNAQGSKDTEAVVPVQVQKFDQIAGFQLDRAR